MSTAKKFYATRAFRDAGTEKSLKLGEDVSGEPGVGNYVAAGLASDQKPEQSRDAAPAA